MRKCKSCKEEYEPTRRNNLYCSKACKNAFNNEKYQDRHSGLIQTTREIKRNAIIVRRQFVYYGDRVHLSELTALGFNPAFTNYRRADGHMVIDNWGLEEIAKDTYKIYPPENFGK